jgi:hypothetical protein
VPARCHSHFTQHHVLSTKIFLAGDLLGTILIVHELRRLPGLGTGYDRLAAPLRKLQLRWINDAVSEQCLLLPSRTC